MVQLSNGSIYIKGHHLTKMFKIHVHVRMYMDTASSNVGICNRVRVNQAFVMEIWAFEAAVVVY